MGSRKTPVMSTPTTDEKDDFILSCRYGDIEDVKLFVDQFGIAVAAEVKDDNGNTPLHMLCGNGHAGTPLDEGPKLSNISDFYAEFS
jgi:ankyrin repeat protein